MSFILVTFHSNLTTRSSAFFLTRHCWSSELQQTSMARPLDHLTPPTSLLPTFPLQLSPVEQRGHWKWVKAWKSKDGVIWFHEESHVLIHFESFWGEARSLSCFSCSCLRNSSKPTSLFMSSGSLRGFSSELFFSGSSKQCTEMELFETRSGTTPIQPNNDNTVSLCSSILSFSKRFSKPAPQQIQKSKPVRYCKLSDHLRGFSFPGLFHDHSLSWSIAMLWPAFIVSCANCHPIGSSISQVSIVSHRSHGNGTHPTSMLSSNRIIPSSSHTGRWWWWFGVDVGKRWRPPSQSPRKWQGRDSCTACCWNGTRCRNGTRCSRSRPRIGILQMRSPRRLCWLCFT